MKFDYIVMNPPYTAPGTSNSKSKQNLDELFLSKAIELADTVVSIQPATWFLNNEKRIKMLNDRHCDANIVSNGLELFQREGANVGQTLGIFRIVKGSGLTVAYDGKDKKSYENVEDFSQADRHSILKTVIEKGKALGSDTLFNHVFSQTHEIGKKLKDSSSLKGKWTVKLTNQNKHIGSPDYDTIMFKDTGIPTLNDGITRIGATFFAFNTQSEAEHFYHYIMTDFVRTYVKAYRRGIALAVCTRFIPWPAAGFTNDWDDDRIAQEIGLTDPERAELASILPDCYGIRKNIPVPVV